MRKKGYRAGLIAAVGLFGLFGLSIQENAMNAAEQAPQKTLVYFGTYADPGDEGIHVYSMDAENGALKRLSATSGAANPSFLAAHPNGRFLYAVNEVGQIDGESTGEVTAYAIDPQSGSLSELNRRRSHGGAPCHIVVHPSGRCVLVANYSGGNVAAFPVAEDGSLEAASSVIQHEGSSVHPNRQRGPHAHSINVAPGGDFVVAADLGIDKLLVYRLSADGRELTANKNQPFAEVAPGAGPRHVAFHPGGRFAYVINELDSTITKFDFEREKGTLTAGASVPTLPEGFEGSSSTAEIQAHPNGRFVYGSNRGHDSIAVFAVDEENGELTPVGHQSTGGKTPRNFGIDPSGRFLIAANQGSDNVVVFRIDPQTGELDKTETEIRISKPVCVKFLIKPE